MDHPQLSFHYHHFFLPTASKEPKEPVTALDQLARTPFMLVAIDSDFQKRCHYLDLAITDSCFDLAHSDLAGSLAHSLRLNRHSRRMPGYHAGQSCFGD